VRQGGKEARRQGSREARGQGMREGGREAGRRQGGSLLDHCTFTSKLRTTTVTLTLLLVIQTGDHAVPKERDSNLTTPAESTLTGVPSSENLSRQNRKSRNQEIKNNTGKVIVQYR